MNSCAHFFGGRSDLLHLIEQYRKPLPRVYLTHGDEDAALSLAQRIESDLEVQRLMLTHFYPACDEIDIAAQCQRSYHGPLILAEDLMTVMVE